MARRMRRNGRGVLEGLPLTLIISVIIAVLGAAILFALFWGSQQAHLSGISVDDGTNHSSVNGWIPTWTTTLELQVTAFSQTHGGLGGVIITLNGSGIDAIGTTPSNGTYTFSLPPPEFPNHATDGSITISARYNPPPQLGASATETATVSEVIIG